MVRARGYEKFENVVIREKFEELNNVREGFHKKTG